ncbi:hypothetical protein ACFE04_014142 [Oxalis oulophora]
MTTYEQDPDVVQWGLRLFESDPYANCGYCGALTLNNDIGHFHGHYTNNHTTYESDTCNNNNVEHDELIAHALQQQLSLLAVTNQSESESPDEDDNLQISNFQHDWLPQSLTGNYTPGEAGYPDDDDDDDDDDADEHMEPSTSCSSLQPKLHNENDWSYPLELTDHFTLEGEMGRRLNQMIPVPHVPRINGEIPSVDIATLDHQRLLDRLQVYDLVECKVQGDGNCQFRALSDQFYRTPEHHEFVRQQVVSQLESCPETYEGYVPMAYNDYLEKMSKNGEWGDHVTLQAAADSYGVKILVITSFKDTCYIEILPSIQRSNREVSACETKKKKRFRTLRNRHNQPSQDTY